MYQNNETYPQPKSNQGQKKQIINQWQGIGVVKLRGQSQQITFYPFQNGGGSIYFDICCTEYAGSDENGNPKYRQNSFPVVVKTNKNISVQTLQSIVPEMKVRVVGALRKRSVVSKKTGKQVEIMEIDAYGLDILEAPRQMPQYGQQSQYMPQPQYGQQPAPGYPQGYPPQYAPQPANPYPPQYMPQPAPQPQPTPQPQYVQQPSYPTQQQQPQQGFSSLGPGEDLPAGNQPGNPNIRDINI